MLLAIKIPPTPVVAFPVTAFPLVASPDTPNPLVAIPFTTPDKVVPVKVALVPDHAPVSVPPANGK